jgi:hypothetical protein
MAKPNPILPALNRQQLDQFHSKILKGAADECWPWLGHKDKKGYGRWMYTVSLNKRVSIRPHRMALFLASGTQPVGLLACHRCDNPPCCNPAHLFFGTSQDNMTDAANKGRMASGDKNIMRRHPELSHFNGKKNPQWIVRGRRHGRAKLEAGDVIAIRASFTGKHGDLTRLGKQYGVSHRNILDIIKRKTWRHI